MSAYCKNCGKPMPPDAKPREYVHQECLVKRK